MRSVELSKRQRKVLVMESPVVQACREMLTPAAERLAGKGAGRRGRAIKVRRARKS